MIWLKSFKGFCAKSGTGRDLIGRAIPLVCTTTSAPALLKMATKWSETWVPFKIPKFKTYIVHSIAGFVYYMLLYYSASSTYINIEGRHSGDWKLELFFIIVQ